MTFGDEQVALLKAGCGDKFGSGGRRRGSVGGAGGGIDGQLQDIGDVDADVDHGSALLAKVFRQEGRFLNDLRAGVRNGGDSDDTLLQVDNDESCFCGMQMKRVHGTPEGRGIFGFTRI